MDIVLARLENTRNLFDYKSETSADLVEWGEEATDRISSWVLAMARRFTEKIAGKNLDDAFSDGRADTTEERPSVSVGIGRSWASVYRRGDRHEAHFHPNTALSAIYYVTAPDTCELDLLDPRTGIGYYDSGISFGGEGHVIRLRCKPGELVLFPGWLKHAVPEFGDDSLRISLSWNIGFSLGDPPEGRP
ncbi:putative 2OG-Fe(II) oxygenase [Saccharothrix longispora]|uniref:Uncharacterized protein (TIGR02466 family) n=1 Tax=Saccharothrix longispora TaxID=33920 RepID=A0ABU1PVN4_9PSEU|nr:putative 2OG-Fe(II) oxygenase [Saccharothrix longispora]MDR6594516.1 uncharacterized protein (TIGR02466 family) [Saccharothrix longispora]